MAGDIYERITRNLVSREPLPKGLRFAAVSIMLSESESPSVLLIKRADRPGDPWSGQIAFPGGKMQPEDGTAIRTAVRETKEEVGVDLGRTADFLGYGPLTTTHTGTMEVVPSVFVLKEKVEVLPNEEVASYRWANLGELLAPGSASSYTLRYEGGSVQMPAFLVGDYVVWGLTHRILTTVLSTG
ncbi:MAG TPA: CoA pyrophosphatase [Nitrososphaerales archaeon]|nr:CoA pyrophosphatase [Nitrososphaerales archaeon]